MLILKQVNDTRQITRYDQSNKKHTKIKILILLLMLMLVLVACPKYKYFTGSFPETPTNLAKFNSKFDDYNSTLPFLGETFPLCFSSNRNSSGADYDIVYKLMSIEFSKINGILRIYEQDQSNLNVYTYNYNINNALEKINTSYDEYGPCLIFIGKFFTGTQNKNTFIFLYSNNSGGSQDIMFTHNIEDGNYLTPQKIEFLNSESDDAYPTFNNDNSKIYFCSNRDGNFNIYKVQTDNSANILEKLTASSPASVEKDTILSSGFDDKCPLISNDLLVFASNREGGFGGIFVVSPQQQ